MKEMFETVHEESSELMDISEDYILDCCERDKIQNLKSWEWIFAKGPKFELLFGNEERIFIEEGRVISSKNIELISEKLSTRLLLSILTKKIRLLLSILTK